MIASRSTDWGPGATPPTGGSCSIAQANRKERKAGIAAIQNTRRMSSANSSISAIAMRGRGAADRVERLSQP